MALDELTEHLSQLNKSLSSIEAVVDVPAKNKQIEELETEASAPDLWNDQEHAQSVTSRLSRLQSSVEKVQTLRSRLDDASTLLELASEESDADTAQEAEKEIATLADEIDTLEVQTLLSGEYDERDALVTIRSEAGGVDAADFAAMLLRMYERWAERHAYSYEVYDISYAEEAGIKSATFTVKSPYAYGTLSVEQGTHRLVRISPFDNQGRRQTSFAGVEVLPVVEETDNIDIPEKDIRVDVFHASGPGGQGVNTTDSAVRITHLPPALSSPARTSGPRSRTRPRDCACSRQSCWNVPARSARPRWMPQVGRELVGQPDAFLCAAPVPDGQGPAHRIRERQPRQRLRW